MRRNGKGQADVHPRGIAFDWRIEKPLDLGESDDLIELTPYLRAAHPEDRAVEKDILAPGQFGMKAGADLEQAGDPAAQGDAPLGRLGYAGQDLEQRALAGAVPANDAEDLALAHLEVNILE